MKIKNVTILSLILLAIFTRLIPHPPNMTPITSIALFAGNRFDNKRMSFLLPLIPMFISDIFLGFSYITFFVYLAFIMITYIGINSENINYSVIIKSSILFFLVTNFGVWLLAYPNTLTGLVSCYTLAIPFFVNSLIGNFFFSYLLNFTFLKVEENYLNQISQSNWS